MSRARIGVASLALALAACSPATAPPKEGSTTPSGAAGDGGATTSARTVVTDGGATVSGDPAAKVPSMPLVTTPGTPNPPVKITLKTTPPKKAVVMWGRQNMGITPVTFERPQGSGPLDLKVSFEGFFPVHVRVYTDKNDTHTVVLTKLSDRMKLLGAKKELPPPASPTDGGVPPPAPTPAVAPAPVPAPVFVPAPAPTTKPK